jgi:hypothetical protein
MSAPARMDSEAVKARAAALLALLPAAIRSRDAAEGGALAAYLAVLASGSVELDAALDAMADAAFVETADARGLDDIGALVGATPLVPLPPGSNQNLRAYVANALKNRAGKGTARALEQLAADVTGFGVIVVEYFQRLARTEHLIDVRADRPSIAAPRLGVTAGQTGTGFDRLPRLVDVRSIARANGRHHVPHVGVHVQRTLVPVFPAPPGDKLDANALAGVPALAQWRKKVGCCWQEEKGFFRLAGQDDGVVRLFNPDRRSAHNGARPGVVALPGRLARLPLHLEIEEYRRAAKDGRPPRLDGPAWFADDAPFTLFIMREGEDHFTRVTPQRLRIANLENRPVKRPDHTDDVDAVIDPVTARVVIPSPGDVVKDVIAVRLAYAQGVAHPIGAGPQERNDDSVPFDIVDRPGLHHFIRIIDATVASGPVDGGAQQRKVPSLADALADWKEAAKDRKYQRALFILTRCDREISSTNFELPLAPGVEHHLVAAQWRPFVPRPGMAPDPGRLGFLVRRERKAVLEAKLSITALSPSLPGEVEGSGTLVIDGLELAAGLSLAGNAAQHIRVRHATVRSPKQDAVKVGTPLAGGTIRIEDSIVGRLALSADKASGSLVLHNVVVARDDAPGDTAIAADALDASLTNVTVLGETRVKSLEATNVLFAARVVAQRTQAGCVRYSHIPNLFDAVNPSQVPRRFRCQPDLARAAAQQAKGTPLSDGEKRLADQSVLPMFLDDRLDEPTLAMLSPHASDLLKQGGEGGAEIGAFALAAAGLRLANLERLFAEVLPFGLEAGVIDDTRSTAAALRRNIP